ncbi:MAG: hypothetical protein AAF570_02050, partial [Bacteroidota bacterium]
QLFRIMATMKSAEKAYFKKFGYKQEKQQSAALALFTLIEKYLRKSVEVDEQKLSTEFEKKHPKARYTKTKSRLLELLLEALRAYDKKGNEAEKVYDYLAYAESLRKRELFYDAWQILQKAEKLAEELELVELLIYIKSQKYYYEIFTEKYRADQVHNATLDDLLSDLELLKNRLETDFAAYRILHFQKSIGVPRTPSDFKLLETIRQHPAFEPDYDCALESSRLTLAVALSGIFFSIGDIASVIRVSENLLQRFKGSEKLRKRNSAKLLTLFDAFLQAALLSLNVPLYERHYPKFRDLQTYGEGDRNLKTGIDLYCRSIYAIVAQRLDLLSELVQAFSEVREMSYIPNYRRVSLGYYMSFGPFLNDDFSTAFEQIQWLKNNQHLGIRYDVEVAMLEMECIILLKKEEFEVLEYRVRAFDAFLKKHERKSGVEAVALRYFRRCLEAGTSKAIEANAPDALAELEAAIAEDPKAAAALNAFDLRAWLQAQIEGHSFQHCYYRNNFPAE